MPSPRRRRLVVLTLLLAGLSVAPAAPERSPPAGRPPLAEARYRGGREAVRDHLVLLPAGPDRLVQVYVWSRLVLDSRREMGETPADRIAALEDHLARMKRMEELIRKIRRLGFGRSSDVGASRILSPGGGALAGPGRRRGGMRVHRPAGAGAAAWRAGGPGRAAHRQKQSSGSSAMNSRAWSRARIVPNEPTGRHRSW